MSIITPEIVRKLRDELADMGWLLPDRAVGNALRAVLPDIWEAAAKVAETHASVMEEQRDDFLNEGPPNTRPALVRARQAQTAMAIAAAIRRLTQEEGR